MNSRCHLDCLGFVKAKLHVIFFFFVPFCLHKLWKMSGSHPPDIYLHTILSTFKQKVKSSLSDIIRRLNSLTLLVNVAMGVQEVLKKRNNNH